MNEILMFFGRHFVKNLKNNQTTTVFLISILSIDMTMNDGLILRYSGRFVQLKTSA